jgi:hypothetical protein
MFALLLSAVLAQRQQLITPPVQCQQQCQQFNLSSCQQPSAPQNDQQWAEAIQKLSECVCPIVLQNQNSCGACLNNNAPVSSIYYSQLASKCVQGTVGEEIALLWDLKNAQIGSATASPGSQAAAPSPPTGNAFSTALSAVALIPLIFL